MFSFFRKNKPSLKTDLDDHGNLSLSSLEELKAGRFSLYDDVNPHNYTGPISLLSIKMSKQIDFYAADFVSVVKLEADSLSERLNNLNEDEDEFDNLESDLARFLTAYNEIYQIVEQQLKKDEGKSSKEGFTPVYKQLEILLFRRVLYQLDNIVMPLNLALSKREK